MAATVPLGRMGNPDEVAKVASFLASDESSFITGIDTSSPSFVTIAQWFGFAGDLYLIKLAVKGRIEYLKKGE